MIIVSWKALLITLTDRYYTICINSMYMHKTNPLLVIYEQTHLDRSVLHSAEIAIQGNYKSCRPNCNGLSVTWFTNQPPFYFTFLFHCSLRRDLQRQGIPPQPTLCQLYHFIRLSISAMAKSLKMHFLKRLQ